MDREDEMTTVDAAPMLASFILWHDGNGNASKSLRGCRLVVCSYCYC
jgi:hypothetical protein